MHRKYNHHTGYCINCEVKKQGVKRRGVVIRLFMINVTISLPAYNFCRHKYNGATTCYSVTLNVASLKLCALFFTCIVDHCSMERDGRSADKAHESDRHKHRHRRSRSREHSKKHDRHKDSHRRSRSRSRSHSHSRRHRHHRDESSRKSSRSGHHSRSRSRSGHRHSKHHHADAGDTPDWAGAASVLEMLLSTMPSVASEIGPLFKAMDEGATVVIDDIQDKFLRSGLEAMFTCLHMREPDSDAFSCARLSSSLFDHFKAMLEQTQTGQEAPLQPAASAPAVDAGVEHEETPVVRIGPARPTAEMLAAGSLFDAQKEKDNSEEGDTSDDEVGPFIPGDPRQRRPAVEEEIVAEGVDEGEGGSKREKWMSLVPDELASMGRRRPVVKGASRGPSGPAKPAAPPPPVEASPPRKSLVDLCREESAKAASSGAPAPRKAFDRETDLIIRKPVDVSKVIENAGKLQSRFGSSGAHSSFM